MFKKISIIGGGSWGTALALLVSEHGLPITIWAHNPAVAEEINSRHTNSHYLPGINLPHNVKATVDLAEAATGDLIVVVVPSKVMRATAQSLAALNLPDGTVVVSCTKGIESGTGLLMSQVLGEFLPHCHLAVLSGPNLAPEIARQIPAATVIGSGHADLLEPLQRIFSSKGFRAYTTDDITGVQLGGALKNI